MSEHSPTEDLLKARGRLMDSLNRLRAASKQWTGSDIARGENTMANLMQQVYEIDEALMKRPEAREEQYA